jgi:tetratricopeptide (TPR) repeat protein
MKSARALAVLTLISGGCFPSHLSTPEEEALEVFDAAENQFAAGRFDDAATGYEFVIKARSRWKEPHLKLARCYETLGRTDEAIGALQKMLAFDRHDETGLREVARLEAMRKR